MVFEKKPISKGDIHYRQLSLEARHVGIKAVIFDLDGTLTEFNLDYKTVRAEVMQLLIRHGLPASLFSLNESIFEMLKKTQVYFRNLGRRTREFTELKKKALSIACKHELQAARDTSLLPGSIETLKRLKEMNLKLGIFTLNCEQSTSHILHNLHLKPFFDTIITRDAVSKVKPDPTHLVVAMKALNVEPCETTVVGDSAVDMESAKSSNAYPIGLITETNSEKILNLAGARTLIGSITELPPLISKLNLD